MLEMSGAVEIVKIILYAGGGALGMKFLDLTFQRFFPTKEATATANKLSSESANISLAGGLQAFQVADESLAEWIGTARQATRELMLVSRKLNEIENICDDLIRLMERILNLMPKSEDGSFNQFARELADLKTERDKMREKG